MSPAILPNNDVHVTGPGGGCSPGPVTLRGSARPSCGHDGGPPVVGLTGPVIQPLGDRVEFAHRPGDTEVFGQVLPNQPVDVFHGRFLPGLPGSVKNTPSVRYRAMW